ncbi:aminopeptidase P family protein [Campylobacter troglodytis]|uniref:aminopeptidase P family protein n=1 Tax=Campylobacter troglodytis TaxID=654363 RepID=UPI001158D7B6|nr:aminopeptidase P family protein [Campylobacter troglodytis]TQR60999.1 Xaa-Pro aminopeptidase [Campylobacter troglodytis]
MNIYAKRISSLQKLMKQENLNAYIVPTADPHFNEYLPECFNDRVFISGFTGSAGTLVVLAKSAHLFTDGRYWIQAEKELLGSNIVLEKQSLQHNFISFLSKVLENEACIGVNDRILSMSFNKELKKQCKKGKFELKYLDLSSKIISPRPPLPQKEIFEQKIAYQGARVVQKLRKIRAKMQESKANYHFISSLDDIAYITNLRGLDIDFNPVFLSFLLIDQSKASLFVAKDKLSTRLINKLELQGFTVYKYEEVDQILAQIEGESILLDPQKTSVHFANLLKSKNNKLIKATNPSTLLKACKNSKEIKNIKNAMKADAIALCHFFAWLEKAIKREPKLNELDIDARLSAFRARHPLYICNSFSTIAGFNANSALPHYRATKNNYSYISKNGLLLIDAGAQYQNGTTDLTRIAPIGRVSSAQKKDYTLVLKSLIALSTATFPKNIALPLLDSLARVNLWDFNLDYMHGTGHGVGYFLNVHEAPVGISYFSKLKTHNKAKEGMISSIEPGIYRKNKWGIRLENLVVIVESEKKEREFGEFLRFETLSLCPFESLLIDFSMLNEKEKTWLSQYHQKIFKTVSPYLEGSSLNWLKKKIKKFI